jgi:hypothetical protein
MSERRGKEGTPSSVAAAISLWEMVRCTLWKQIISSSTKTEALDPAPEIGKQTFFFGRRLHCAMLVGFHSNIGYSDSRHACNSMVKPELFERKNSSPPNP